jgi:gliding motility-associated-like protein
MEFVQNKGQWNKQVDYRGDFSGGSFFLEDKGFTVLLHNPDDLKKMSQKIHGHSAPNNPNLDIPISVNNGSADIIVRSHAYKVNFLGSSTTPQRIPDKALPSYNNYFIGNDKSTWASDCKLFQAVTYKNVYPNIDVRYYSSGSSIKYDIIVNPGGNPNNIAMRYDGVNSLTVKNKELIIGTSVGEIKELYPYTYQIQNKETKTIDCKYVVKNNVVTFNVKNYVATSTLVIDPSLLFSTFTGANTDNWGYTATPGPDGSFFAGGVVFATGYPVSAGAFQNNFGGGVNDDGLNKPYEIAIFKFSPNGANRVYATYLGGSGNEQPHSMICDAQGNLIITGRSNSGNYPGTPVTTKTDYDIFVTKFNAAGTGLIGSARIGGSNDDGVNIRSKYNNPRGAERIRRNYGDDSRSEVIIDGGGNIYIASCTQSVNFPVTNSSIQPSFGGGAQDGVIIKYNSTLSAPLFSTFFGGNGDDACFVLSINPLTNDLYVGGGTTSNNLPGNKVGVISSTYQGGETDGFVSQLRNDGSAIIKTTYQGTSGTDIVYGVQFDKFGFPYIMGTTTGDWPVLNATFSNTGGKQFISKLKPDLSTYVYSTVFGTNTSVPNISPVAFLVDRCQNVYVSGWGGTSNTDQLYPSAGTAGLAEVNPLVRANGQPITQPDGSDFYFFVLEKNAQSQLFGSHFGQQGGQIGDHVDGGTSRFDANGIIYQAICANCGGGAFPTTGGVWSSTNNSGGGCNQAAIKIEMNFAGIGASVKAAINGVIDTIGCVPLKVDFVDTLAKGKQYIWDYGDAASPKRDTTFAPNNKTSHIYTQVGTFRLMLIAIDSNTCNVVDTAYISVKVGNNIIAPDFSFVKLDSCKSLRYQFTNLTNAVVPKYTNKTFEWDFGDQSPRVITNAGPVTHTFPAVGSYKITLSTYDSTFCNAPDSITKTLRISPNVKAIFKTDAKGCAPADAVFENLSLGGTDFVWEFGDNTTSTDGSPKITHTYTNPGIYKARLIAKDTSTCNKIDTSAYFTITISAIPVADFTFAPNPPIENKPTSFTNLSVGAVRYLWDFADGETSTEVNPIHQFNKTDTFLVSLIAFNAADCPDTVIIPVPILVRPLLDVPNAFTPGKFGTNGIVKVAGFGIGKMSWKIYNRWGGIVFQTSNRSQGWDGTFRGAIQPIDVYTYTLDVEFTDGKKIRKTGDINLLR